MISQLEKQGEEFRKLFLLKFTRELIKNTKGDEIFKLKKILEEEEVLKKDERLNRIIRQERYTQEVSKNKIEEKEFKKSIPEIIPKKVNPESKREENKFLEKRLEKRFEQPIKKFPIRKIRENHIPSREIIKRNPVLRVPEPISSREINYLRQGAKKNKNIELDKLNPLIADPLIKVIECNGPDKNILIRGDVGIKKTSIILNKDEIKEIMRKFSEVSRIPLQEGVFKVVHGNLILSAVISDIVGTKFIIRKMTPIFQNPMSRNNLQLRR
jgi:hypothetical protein